MINSIDPQNCNSKSRVEIPVFVYHVVSKNPDMNNQYQFSLTEFKSQMDYLKAGGYTTLAIDKYFNIINKTATMPVKPVLLTFDDCTEDFYSNVYPILKQYGMKATQFAVSDWIDTPGHMTAEQLKTVMANGIDVQNHTADHSDLNKLSHDRKYSIINDATAKIVSFTGKTTLFCAYPYGNYDADTILVLKALGFKAGFTVDECLSTDTGDKYTLPRILISNGDSLSVFKKKLNGQ